jgi:hypothetical protein
MSRIAIDPGMNGGFAIADGDEIEVIKMPDTYPGILDVLHKLSMDIIRPSVVIEDVGYHVQGNHASASCKFARHVGHLEMALYAVNMPVQRVRPVKWQRMFTLPTDKKQRKRKMKELMAAQYPYLKVTDWNADALGILTWALKESE